MKRKKQVNFLSRSRMLACQGEGRTRRRPKLGGGGVMRRRGNNQKIEQSTHRKDEEWEERLEKLSPISGEKWWGGRN